MASKHVCIWHLRMYAYLPALHLKVAGYVRECATAEEAAERVVSEAFKARGLRDDITAAVGWLGTPPWVAERKAKRGFLCRLTSTGSSRSSGAPAV